MSNTVTTATPISSLIANKRRVSALKGLGVVSVSDALTYYPFRVTEPVPLRAIREARVGAPMAFAAVVRFVRVIPMGARRGYRLEAVVDDGAFAESRQVAASSCRLVFFSHKKPYMNWMSGRLHQGADVVLAGTPTEFNGQLQFTHPEVLTVMPEGAAVFADPASGSVAAVAASAGELSLDGTPSQTDGRSNAGAAPAGSGDSAAHSQPASQAVGESADPSAPAGTNPSSSGSARPGVADVAARANALRFDASSAYEALQHVCRPRPVYHATSRISSEHIHESIVAMLDALRASGKTKLQETGGADDDVVTDNTAVDAAVADNADNADNVAENQVADSKTKTLALRAAIPDILPQDVIASKGLMHRADAFAAIHDPRSTKAFHEALATLRYEEAFVSQVSVLQDRERAREAKTFECGDSGLRARFVDSLPFTLTDGQHDVIDTICEDMARAYPMQRLLQGEVGSGKTVVALAAMLQAVGAGYQAVLVAPTLVLAEQHFQTISGMVAKIGGAGEDDDATVPVTLLTGGMRLAARRKALATAASGEPGIIVATHAAFSKRFQAPNMALVVIDEQHRFGVEQREILREKGEKTPHLLVMTATPIPRTAAMTWFGDLDISWLTELPGGRKPIRTFIVPEADGRMMGQMFVHIRRRIDAGERAYIVCPRIDADPGDDADVAGAGRAGGRGGRRATAGAGADDVESGFVEVDDFGDENGDGTPSEPKPPLHAVDEIARRLSGLPQFQGIRFATLTGRDDDETKRAVMADFESGKTPVLVATTVIEVGVDVPLASCITIFDADRYGLSQLHQLRGRVGRGGTDSWAFLVSRAEPGSIAEQRLKVIEGSLDGAEIAQADLELRGAGDVLGDAQSGGKSGLKLLRVVKDAKIIADARQAAEALLERDSGLAGETQLAGAVLDFTRGGESEILSN
ncbi:ATP-dependent DNA helicase RecG [Bifidobacterium sp. ESL0763]|uniref:ATP-dependent DNA helicase RecG n=1 Tax=Bifidobacterium sp. ESL0763 TaxID=2983227 RepID=UPI0023F74537|nr:ATP-dependent DNA helicase RecG [Bifidobacterium sp. ESL0763]MDF7664366.1 ATP-dependent DNA helicase RecG [Bifidobacterium sp. ESL0763]